MLKFFKITRFSPDIAKYYMLSHKKETPSHTRFDKVDTGSDRFEKDGLRDTEYKVLNHELRTLYSWILVDV